jgi:hypothetical protein
MVLSNVAVTQHPQKYTLFVDLDGVLVDFDKGYNDLTGVSTHHADKQGRDEFWDLYKNNLKLKNIPEKKYWHKLPWTKDGKTLWGYVKKYNPYILTAPAINPKLPKEQRYKPEFNQSIQGKIEWVKRLDNMKDIYFKAAAHKHEKAGPNKILIDDRKDTIDRWNEAGGIGIYHTSSADTIKQLKILGL